MTGTVLQVVNAGTFFLLVVNLRTRIAEQPIERRYLRDILAGEGLAEPSDLVGRQVELSDDGLSIAFV